MRVCHVVNSLVSGLDRERVEVTIREIDHDTGGTLVKSAALLKEKGARSVRALITHPVLSGKAYENIENSVLEELVVCDTIPMKQESSKIKVQSVSDLFAVALRNAFENKSITSLFMHSQRRNK